MSSKCTVFSESTKAAGEAVPRIGGHFVGGRKTLSCLDVAQKNLDFDEMSAQISKYSRMNREICIYLDILTILEA